MRGAPENHLAKREVEHSPRAARMVSWAAGIVLVFLGGLHLMLIQGEPCGPWVGDPWCTDSLIREVADFRRSLTELIFIICFIYLPLCVFTCSWYFCCFRNSRISLHVRSLPCPNHLSTIKPCLFWQNETNIVTHKQKRRVFCVLSSWRS